MRKLIAFCLFAVACGGTVHKASADGQPTAQMMKETCEEQKAMLGFKVDGVRKDIVIVEAAKQKEYANFVLVQNQLTPEEAANVCLWLAGANGEIENASAKEAQAGQLYLSAEAFRMAGNAAMTQQQWGTAIANYQFALADYATCNVRCDEAFVHDTQAWAFILWVRAILQPYMGPGIVH